MSCLHILLMSSLLSIQALARRVQTSQVGFEASSREMQGRKMETKRTASRDDETIHWFYSPDALAFRRPYIWTGHNLIVETACFWTDTYTAHQVNVSCAWYKLARDDAIEIQQGPCPEEEMLQYEADFKMTSCEHRIRVSHAAPSVESSSDQQGSEESEDSEGYEGSEGSEYETWSTSETEWSSDGNSTEDFRDEESEGSEDYSYESWYSETDDSEESPKMLRLSLDRTGIQWPRDLEVAPEATRDGRMRHEGDDESVDVASRNDQTIHWIYAPNSSVYHRPFIYTGTQLIRNSSCFWTRRYTPEEVTLSCAWYKLASRYAFQFQQGPCPEDFESESVYHANFNMHSCAHLYPETIALDSAEHFLLSQIQRPCETECPNADDVLDLHPVKGRRVIRSDRLGQGRHCFELENLVMALKVKPQDPLRSEGDAAYSLDMLVHELDSVCVAI